METKTVNNELWKIDKSAQFSNRSNVMINDVERIMVIEHYRDNVKEREYYENLIVAAVNSCKQINAANPLSAAKVLPDLILKLNKAIWNMKCMLEIEQIKLTLGGTLWRDAKNTVQDAEELLKQATE